jgi:hypothetical protein
MRFRIRAFLWHLAVSSVVLGLLIAGLYLGWYNWPGWYLAGAEFIVGMMVLVDIGLGPLATVVVANPAKPARKLKVDIGLIVLVQLAALIYGTKTLWDGRPLYYVFSASQVDLVQAIAIDPQDTQVALSRGATLVPKWYSRPRWVWARLPDDPDEFKQLLFGRLLLGGDVVTMPQYFHPIAEAVPTMRSAYVQIRSLQGAPEMDDAEYARRLALLGKAEEAVGVLPIVGRAREGAMVFDRATGEPLAYWPVKVKRLASKAE